jgi:hypothetical protein
MKKIEVTIKHKLHLLLEVIHVLEVLEFTIA